MHRSPHRSGSCAQSAYTCNFSWMFSTFLVEPVDTEPAVEKHQALMVETTAPNPRGICWELGDGCANCSSGQSQAARAAVGWVETILSAFLRQGMWCLDGGRGCLRRGNRGQESRGWCSIQPRSSQSAETSIPFFLSSPKMLLLTTQTRTHTRVHTHVHTHIRTHLGPTHLGSRRVW